MSLDDPWTPEVGKLLPRAAEGYSEPEKWDWILAERGHGQEWARVFRIEKKDAQPLWDAIARAVLTAPVYRVIDRGRHGVVCGVEATLTLNARTATVAISWHYAYPNSPPRLITAYPRS
jgi:hypothetical protein